MGTPSLLRRSLGNHNHYAGRASLPYENVGGVVQRQLQDTIETREQSLGLDIR